jgi:hypothetical protein
MKKLAPINGDDDAISERESAAITRRLIVIRTHMDGDNQAAFCRRLGIAPTRWNNIERGFPLTLKMAFHLTKIVDGLTIGYITHGYHERLPTPLKNQLVALEEQLFPSAKGKRSANK